MARFLIGALSAVSFAAVFGTAHAALITSAADPALAGATVLDFGGLATGNAASYTLGGVTFSTPGGTLRIAPFGEGGSGSIGSGQTLTTRDTTAPSRLNILFGGTVSAFGMDWGGANPDWTVRLFDSSSSLLQTLTFDGGDSGGTFREFYGASGAGIARVELVASRYDWVVIDNFHYVPSGGGGNVPEPVTLALVGLGLAGIGVSRRMRRS